MVYSKHCLSHTESVVAYLGRYTYRIAITNHRILEVDENGVLIRYKDYRDHDRHKSLHLEGEEFVRRYLLHILPKGFARIRHYGFLANRNRESNLVQIRQALAATPAKVDEKQAGQDEACYPCPVCKAGCLHRVDLRPAGRQWERWTRRR